MIDPTTSDSAVGAPTATIATLPWHEALRHSVQAACVEPEWEFLQPWRWLTGEQTLTLILDQTLEDDVTDPSNRGVHMLCGAALENARIALRHFGWHEQTHVFPDPEDETALAEVNLVDRGSPSDENETLYRFLPGAPRTLETEHAPRRVSGEFVWHLRRAARAAGGTWLDVISDDARRTLIGDLMAAARARSARERTSRVFLATPPRGMDLSHLSMPATRQFRSFEETLASLGGDIREPKLGTDEQSFWSGFQVVEAPVLAVLGTGGDGRRDWVRAGEALQHLVLRARAQGMSVSLLTDPLAHATLREALRPILFASGFPQVIVRMDFADDEH